MGRIENLSQSRGFWEFLFYLNCALLGANIACCVLAQPFPWANFFTAILMIPVCFISYRNIGQYGR